MKAGLRDVPASCFQGAAPASIVTADLAGMPNVAYVSQILVVDDDHVALPTQFFNETNTNLNANPRAVIDLFDPHSLETFRLDLRFDHAETVGEWFDAMALRIGALASHTGSAVQLISADVFEVLSAERRDGFVDAVKRSPESPRSFSQERALQVLSQRSSEAPNLKALTATLLATLAEVFSFEHGMVLLLDEGSRRLYVVATQGYDGEGVGAEIAVGEGFIGTVALTRTLLRMSSVEGEARFGAHRSNAPKPTDDTMDISLPRLEGAQSQTAIPLAVGDRLVGVLVVESLAQIADSAPDETFLTSVANQAAVILDKAFPRPPQGSDPDAVGTPSQRASGAGGPNRFRLIKNDD